MSTYREPCGWSGSFAKLIASDPNTLAGDLSRGLKERGREQFLAWASSLGVLRSAASDCVQVFSPASDFAAILEYELPRDDRRPDVIVLENGTVVVIEFKEGSRIVSADVDQVYGYARDLKHYHSSCHERHIVPFLVPLGHQGAVQTHKGVTITPAKELGAQILALTTPTSTKPPDRNAWLRGEYAPLPGLADAARRLFQHEPLPRIKRAESAGIPGVVAGLTEIVTDARRRGGRSLVLLTGVPGSGKTLVGLQLVHSPGLAQLVAPDRQGPAPGVFLSGNGPLVDVLQYSLKSKDFVQNLKDYLLHYITRSPSPPPEHVIVFDEAQRAWDARKVFAKHHGSLGKISEPELLLEIAQRIPDWCVVVALIGEGQEIHVGEEEGLFLWADALVRNPTWDVYAPPRVAESLGGSGITAIIESTLDLDTSLRSHIAGNLHQWVAHFLDGDIAAARNVADTLNGYDLYVTNDLDLARRYLRRRYAGQRDRRFGLLASSCAENLRGYALRLKEDGKGGDYGRWYEGRPTGANFCCSLETAVSEFGCQGLELDYAVVLWGDDFSWHDDQWKQRSGKRRRGVKDAHRLRTNAYRVLLTRGRDGTCIFVPPNTTDGGSAAFDAIVAAGAQPLADVDHC